MINGIIVRWLDLARQWHSLAKSGARDTLILSRCGPALLGIHLVALVLAWCVCLILPISYADLAKAKALGIRSLTILNGYPNSHEFIVYIVAEVAAITGTITGWWLWFIWQGGKGDQGNLAVNDFSARCNSEKSLSGRRGKIIDWVIVPIVIAFVAFDADRFVTAWWEMFTFLSEEGMILAAADRLLQGGVLYRDEFALYGPLMFYPLTWLLRAMDSVLMLRVYAYALDVAGFLVLYAALRVFLVHRGWAALGLGFFLLNFFIANDTPGLVFRPSIHESVLRFSIGLVWMVFLLGRPEGPSRRDAFLTGVGLGLAMTFSHEVGLVSCIAWALLVVTGVAWSPRWTDIGRHVLAVGAGFTVAVLPWVAFFIFRGAGREALETLIQYPRYMGLGFSALPFPSIEILGSALKAWVRSPLSPDGGAFIALKGYWIAWVIGFGAIVLGVRALMGFLDRKDRMLWGVVLLAGMLFKVALGRTDLVHYQAALVPAVLAGLLLAKRAVDAIAIGRIRAWSPSVVCLVGLSFMSILVLLPPRPVIVEFAARHTWAIDRKFRGVAGGRVPVTGLKRAEGILLPPENAEEFGAVVHYLRTHTAPDEPFIAFPNEAGYYYYAQRPNPSRFSNSYLAVTRADRCEMIKDWDRHAPRYLVYSLDIYRIDGILEEVQVPELFAYVKRHYIPEVQIGRTLVFKRRPPA